MAKVLVIDDLNCIEELQNCISSHEFLFAPNGKEGLDLLLKNRDTEVICLDCNMPIMDGYQFLEEIERNKDYDFCRNIKKISIGDFRLFDITLIKEIFDAVYEKPLTSKLEFYINLVLSE